MKGLFNPTCDRHGHILAGVGGSPQVMAPFVFPTAEEIALFPGAPEMGLLVQDTGNTLNPGPRIDGRFSSQENISSC